MRLRRLMGTYKGGHMYSSMGVVMILVCVRHELISSMYSVKWSCTNIQIVVGPGLQKTQTSIW
jgi:hypothetical protein